MKKQIRKDNELLIHCLDYPDVDGSSDGTGVYPDFNTWVEALENDPDYIKKVEKRLDIELGVDRVF